MVLEDSGVEILVALSRKRFFNGQAACTECPVETKTSLFIGAIVCIPVFSRQEGFLPTFISIQGDGEDTICFGHWLQ